MALFGPPDIGRLKAKGNVEGLIKALGYEKDREVPKLAIGALGEIGDARAVEPLIKALGEQKWDVCQSAAIALGKIGDARALEPLIAALGDENGTVRRNATTALGEIGDARAVEPLIKVLVDKSESSAAIALGKIGDARAVEPLIALLMDKGRDVRAAAEELSQIGEAAAEALSKIGASASEPLMKVLEDKERYEQQRILAAVALGKIGDARAVAPLIKMLTEGNASVIGSLGEIGDARAVEPLINELGDERGHVRKGAAEALLRIYRKGNLSQEQKQLVLKCKPQITKRHADDTCFGAHGDSGIGIAFDI